MGVLKKNDAGIHPLDASGKPKMGSFSHSQLSASIMDMLNLQGDSNRCQTVCRGNPITNAGKRKQMLKMLAVVMMPISILLGLTTKSFAESLESYMNLSSVRKDLFLGRDIGVFMRMFQRERDISSLYVSKIGPDTKDRLLKRYFDTDSALKNMTGWPVKDRNQRKEFQSKADFMSYLNKHRYEIDITRTDAGKELEFYSDAIQVFISWLYSAISEAKSASVWQSLVAYQEIIVTSEYIGRERGFGVTFYANGYFKDRQAYLRFVESQDIANTTFKSARQFSNIAFEKYDGFVTSDSNVFNTIKEMRYDIRANKTSIGTGSLEYADWWFENMTIYQDIIREVQKDIGDRIDILLDNNSKKDIQYLTLFSLVFGIFVIICAVIVFGVYSLTSQIQKYSLSIAIRTKALKQEKTRTDTLLYQMLPQSVAERLKCDEQVPAELFKESTILFGDIVGFTQIASFSSPVQVVIMLNKLFSCFDERIEEHDVYKVETIGDAYMVVSGVPKQNGHLHAGEIANLALDLQIYISGLKIPHLPGRKFQLRIGCHSGEVVAGIVGMKMPRYCLFGETVTVAAKMESLGQAGMIHVSCTTHDVLEQLGGYNMENRKDDAAKNDRELRNAFRGIVRTYWLIKRDGDQSESHSSSSRNTTPDCHLGTKQ